jgi:protein O-mannosyl-transferase
MGRPQVQALSLTRPDSSRADRQGWWLAALLVLVAACYAPAWNGPYQFDDHVGVAVDPAAASLEAWWHGAAAHVRPLLKASFALSHGLGEAIGHVPAGHRLVNLGFHLATIALLFVLGRQVARVALPQWPAQRGTIAAALAAALFGLHPLATEAVSYVSGRSMSLGTLLACASLVCWARGRDGSSPRWIVASWLVAALAALSRETVVFSLVLLVPASELLRRRQCVGVAVAPTAPATGSAAGLAAATVFTAIAAATLLWMLLGNDRYGALLRLSWWIAQMRAGDASLLAALEHFAHVATLLRPPSIDPDVAASMPLPSRVAMTAIVASALVAAWRVRASRPQWLVAAAWVLAWLLPLYAVPLRHDAVSERHFYAALWGPAWALAVTLVSAAQAQRWQHVSSLPRASAFAALLALSVLTVTRNLDYRSEAALWQAALHTDPHKLRVLNNAGFAYMEAGRWNDALEVLQVASALHPDDHRVRWNLAAARARDLRVLDQPALPPWD